MAKFAREIVFKQNPISKRNGIFLLLNYESGFALVNNDRDSMFD